MSSTSPFIIPIHGLSTGTHRYDLEVEESFFEDHEESEIEKGSGKVELLLHKTERMLQLEFYIKGAVELPCDRCGIPFDQLLELRKKLYMKFGERSYEKGDDLEVLGNDVHELDLSRHIYEFFHLALPLKRVHEEGSCDEEALQRLKDHQTREGSDGVDPRWEELKKLRKGA